VVLAWKGRSIFLAWPPCKVVLAWKGRSIFLAWPPCKVLLAFKGRYCWLQYCTRWCWLVGGIIIQREASTRYGRSAYLALARLVLNMAAVQIGGAGVEGLVAYWKASTRYDRCTYVELTRLVPNMSGLQIGGASVDGRRAPRWSLLAGSLHSSLCWGPSRPPYLQVIRLRSHSPRYSAVV
jgi:hypothetical protein